MPESVPLPDSESFDNKEQTLNFGALLNDTPQVPEHVETPIGDDLFSAEPQVEEKVPEPKPVYEQPVTQAKPEMVKTPVKKRPAKKRQDKSLKRNQMDFNFGDEDIASDDLPSISAKEEPTLESKPVAEVEPQVIVLSVVMPEGQVMSGAALLPTLLTLGMKYGDMNIFQSSSG